MKSVIILLSLLAGTAFAQNSAPIFAKLQVSGVTRNMTTINPRFSSISSAHVTFNNKSLQLTLTKRMPACHNICAMVMPAPVEIKLQVIEVVRTECSVQYLAVTPANVLSAVYEEVMIEDFTNSKCMTTMDVRYTPGTLTYKVTGVSSLSRQTETATAHFNVDGDFIRALN